MAVTDKIQVKPEQFGKDHWSMLAYIDCRCVDNKGVPDRDHMRTNIFRHPGLIGPRVSDMVMSKPARERWNPEHGTRLSDGSKLRDHDDWDCVDDLENVGYVEIQGTGIAPVYKLTEKGVNEVNSLRGWKRAGGNFAEYKAVC